MFSKRMRRGCLWLAVAGVFAVPQAKAEEETASFRSDLRASDEAEPPGAAAAGAAIINFDAGSRELRWIVNYSGLAGTPLVAAFHGPWDNGERATALALPGDLTSPILGRATLTSEQAADLLAGNWYLDIATTARPGGEIRGEVRRAGQVLSAE